MAVRFDFHDISLELDAAPSRVAGVFDKMGQEAVGYAREHGDYQNHTFRLRNGTDYLSDERTLLVENDTPYASNVEHRGYDVLTGARYHIQNKYGLKEQ